ncbi:MAG: TetR/AcrR family transcriptional regulator [Spirochaetales bacterium]|nr:TetR/AcrR family transcriptional regulator [Leptospiraceae bacterium]MCP5481300.1 TetR/AcrR family transcriptional regulator [Spirochaetales bacterium]MCP5485736.1 TetR/AcrR family transcriptional regulator [Spirochaetales bacterium]
MSIIFSGNLRPIPQADLVADAGDSQFDDLGDARSAANPGARLLAAARDLFDEHGYAGAGINEIIARSNTSKKSFYSYYPSKRDLGEAYLREQEAHLLEQLDQMAGKYAGDYAAFVRAWARSLKAGARLNQRYGCPFASTAAQTSDEFSELLGSIVSGWSAKLEVFLSDCFSEFSRQQIRTLSRLILVQYEGSIQMWRLTKDPNYFDLFEGATGALPIAVQNLRSGGRRPVRARSKHKSF